MAIYSFSVSRERSIFEMGQVKEIFRQLLSAIVHLHSRWIVHRDLKTSNLLLSNRGQVQVADFGLARRMGPQSEHLTPTVVTLWYRAPEILLGGRQYTSAVDIWSAGCILAELLIGRPLLPGNTEIAQIDKIFSMLGYPKPTNSLHKLPQISKISAEKYENRSASFALRAVMSKYGVELSDAGLDLLMRCLELDPEKRITAKEALDHEFFREQPLPLHPSLFPSWPSTKGARER